MTAPAFAPLTNGVRAARAALPDLSPADFRSGILNAVASGGRVAALFGAAPGGGAAPGAVAAAGAVAEAPPAARPNRLELYAVLADDAAGGLYAARTTVPADSFASLAADCPQVQLFEREIAEQFGAVPLGHPWLKPVRYRRSWTGRDAWKRPAGEPIQPGGGDFYRVEGEQVHEVAVGPVHAGVIEPGHFRFQCHGEEVFHLEIALGYQHRGVEEALIGGPDARSPHYAATLAGDATIGHGTAYCMAVEALAGTKPSARAQALRGVALELERLANHVGDLGALAGDVGFLPAASYCGRLRGDFLNMSALLCGNRFGRGLATPGGVGFDLEPARAAELAKRLDAAAADTANAVNLLWDNQAVMARFEDTGVLPKDTARELGIVGPAARASGLARDVRADHPFGIYRFTQIPVSSYDSGDVFARAYVRWLDIQHSVAFIREQLAALPGGELRRPLGALEPDSLAVALTEGWRGEICHVALTGADGRFERYKIVDPSFHNWSALAYTLRGQEISDFPLCNKSFNLSYCGHDL
jgi:Ni,Fe-hydrogenase III large subunit